MASGIRLALFALLLAVAGVGGWLAGDAVGPEPSAGDHGGIHVEGSP